VVKQGHDVRSIADADERLGDGVGKVGILAKFRRCDRTIDHVVKTMGLSVESRARLGYVVSQARLANAEVERLLGTDFLKENIQ
jgi:hypothetical protein